MNGDELTPYERLMAEDLPTGTFGRSRPPKTRRTPGPAPAATHRAVEAVTPPGSHTPWTPEDQARHVADLLAELDGWEWHDEYADAKRERDQDRRTHLRLIDTDAADETAA